MVSHRRTKSESNRSDPSGAAAHVHLTTHDVSALLSRMARLEAELNEANMKLPSSKKDTSQSIDSIGLYANYPSEVHAALTDVSSQVANILLSLPLMENIVDTVKRGLGSQRIDNIEDNILLNLCDAIHDSKSPWSRLGIMNNIQRCAHLRTLDNYFSVIDIALSARRNTQNYKKIAKYWKKLVIIQQDTPLNIPMTPSPSDISDTGLSEELQPQRKERLDELIAKRKLVISDPSCDVGSYELDTDFIYTQTTQSTLVTSESTTCDTDTESDTSKVSSGGTPTRKAIDMNTSSPETQAISKDAVKKCINNSPFPGSQTLVKSRLKPKSPPFSQIKVWKSTPTSKQTSISTSSGSKSRKTSPRSEKRHRICEATEIRQTVAVHSSSAKSKVSQKQSCHNSSVPAVLVTKQERISQSNSGKDAIMTARVKASQSSHNLRALNLPQNCRPLAGKSPLTNQLTTNTLHTHTTRNYIATT